MQRGLLPPCQVSRGVYRAWLAKTHSLNCMWGGHIPFKGFQVASGRYPEYFRTEPEDAKVMPDKQDRYRKRKADQGLYRVEVLIPQDDVPLLKAYARALRDAHSLGLDAPLFDGMEHRLDGRPTGATSVRHAPTPRAGGTSNAAITRTAKLKANADLQNIRNVPDKKRPDFSKGLLDE